MPREFIRGSVPPYHVQVGWNHDVQIGVESERAHSLFWMLLGVEDPIIDAAKDDVEEARILAAHAKRLDRLGSHLRASVATAAGVELHLDGKDEAIARAVLTTLDEYAGHNIRGLWAHLDRPQVNRLVKLLRKARDAAFGRDE